MNDKIAPSHLQRKAMLYVRQSSLHQVAHNQESRRLQYAMKERLQQLGWSAIEVIDEDLGRSAAGTVTRAGFERMVAEVSLGRVGAVAAREVSRFARNNRDWQQLIEVCRVVDTLLIDQETVYDPRRSNDRLLLGLKGSLNEYELDLLRHRALEARREKAQRGELIVAAPIGYIAAETGYEMDPDQRVRQAIELVFAKFLELGSVRQVLFWFVELDLQLPTRSCVNGSWQTYWRRPNYGAVYRMLTHPIYAGAYVYGQTQRVTRWDAGRPRRHTLTRPRGQSSVLLPDHHEGYISWEKFQRIQRMIAGNNALASEQATGGAAKTGAALLVGLLRCRRCGRKLTVRYTGREHDALRYCCFRACQDNGEPRCISFGGTGVDEAIGMEALRMLRPAAVEAALQIAHHQSEQRNQVVVALELELKAARYTAERARQQYDATDPKNRLVADELERRWNRALEGVAELEARIARGTQSTSTTELAFGTCICLFGQGHQQALGTSPNRRAPQEAHSPDLDRGGACRCQSGSGGSSTYRPLEGWSSYGTERRTAATRAEQQAYNCRDCGNGRSTEADHLRRQHCRLAQSKWFTDRVGQILDKGGGRISAQRARDRPAFS